MNAPKIFISYSHSDQAWAREFAKSMVDNGIDVWSDQNTLRAGASYSDVLEEGLRKSDAVVLLVTRESLGRPNLLFELGAAFGLNKKIIPIVSEDVDTTSLPVPLSRKFLRRRSPAETAGELAAEIAFLYGDAA
ncbi:MAG: toll/interleukin-1 receptor domain-containing protein [Acidobacteriota bacterium]